MLPLIYTIELVTGIRPSGSNGGDPVSWQSTRTSQTLYHETEPETLRQYTEVSDQAQDGQGYYAMALVWFPKCLVAITKLT